MRVNVDFPPNAQWKTDRIIMDISSVMLILYYCSIVIGESFDFKSVLFSIWRKEYLEDTIVMKVYSFV